MSLCLFCFSSYQSLFHIFRYFLFAKNNASEQAMKACFQIASATYFLRKDIKKYPLAQIIRG